MSEKAQQPKAHHHAYEPGDVLDIHEAAKLLKLASVSMYALAARRRIASVKILGRRRFLRQDIEAIIRNGRQPAVVGRAAEHNWGRKDGAVSQKEVMRVAKGKGKPKPPPQGPKPGKMSGGKC